MRYCLTFDKYHAIIILIVEQQGIKNMATTTKRLESWLDVKATSIYGAEVYIDRFMGDDVEVMTGKIVTKLVTVTVTQPIEEAGVPRIDFALACGGKFSFYGDSGSANVNGVVASISISDSGEIDHFLAMDEDTMIRYSKTQGWSKEGWKFILAI